MPARPLLRLAWQTYRAHFGFFIVAALVVVLPTALLEVLFDHFSHVEVDKIDDLDAETIGTIGAAVLFLVGATLGHELYAGLISFTVVETQAGRPRPTLRQATRHLPVIRLMIADLLYTVILAVGFALLFAPGILAATWFALVAPVIEVENRSVRAAFARSRELVRGHFWLVLAFIAVLFVVNDALTVGAHELVEETLGSDTFLLEWLASILADLASTPIYGVAIVTLMLVLAKRRPDGGGADVAGAVGRAG